MNAMTSILRRASPGAVLLAALALVPPILNLIGEPYYVGLATRAVIFGIAAVSLDLIVGYGGMVSLGHAAYIGIGGYSVGILSFYGVGGGYAHFGTAILASAIAAALIGSVSMRTRGIHLIMITLAFGQMLYYLAISASVFGGDDGLSIASNSDFGPVDLSDPTTLYFVSYAVLVVVIVALHRLTNARFGVVLRAIRSNEGRARAIGYSAYGYRLAAFVVAGTVCGIAGALLAEQNLFVSPTGMQWEQSGEILIMAILGGSGSLTGAVIGSTLFVLLQYFLARFTDHWQVLLGLVVLGVVLSGAGRASAFASRRRRKVMVAHP